MNRNTKAVLLIAAGTIGILLPIVPGFPLMIMGANLFQPADSRLLQRFLADYRKRFNASDAGKLQGNRRRWQP